MKAHRISRTLLRALFLLICRPDSAQGDGGTLRAWKQAGAFDMAVFTEPSPVVTGPVDVSVLLLDRQTGEPITDARIVVEIAPVGGSGPALRRRADSNAATNKLLRAAVLDLKDPGRYKVAVSIKAGTLGERIEFEVAVASAWSPQSGTWPWILWPFPVIFLYMIHRRLVDQRGKS